MCAIGSINPDLRLASDTKENLEFLANEINHLLTDDEQEMIAEEIHEFLSVDSVPELGKTRI